MWKIIVQIAGDRHNIRTDTFERFFGKSARRAIATGRDNADRTREFHVLHEVRDISFAHAIDIAAGPARTAHLLSV